MSSPQVIDSQKSLIQQFLEQRQRNRDKLRRMYAEAQQKDADAKSGDGDSPTNSLEQVMGRAMHHTMLMKRLKWCNQNFYFEVSPVTKRIGIYYPDPAAKGTPDAPRVRYLGMTIAQGINPEFTPKFSNERGELKSVETGYRSVLARLIRQGFITEAQACKHFGLPSRSSLRWQTAIT